MHTVKVNLIADQEITITKPRSDGNGDVLVDRINIHNLRSIVIDSNGRIVDYSLNETKDDGDTNSE